MELGWSYVSINVLTEKAMFLLDQDVLHNTCQNKIHY